MALASTLTLPLAIAVCAAQGAQPGSEAPDLRLRDQDGREWSLQGLRGRGWVLLAFFPKANTPG